MHFLTSSWTFRETLSRVSFQKYDKKVHKRSFSSFSDKFSLKNRNCKMFVISLLRVIFIFCAERHDASKQMRAVMSSSLIILKLNYE